MAFLDGELPADRAAAVHAHLVSCDICQRLESELRGVSRDLARWNAGDAPRSLTAPMAIPPSPSPLRRRLAWRPMVLAPTAGVAAIAILVAVMSSRTRQAHAPAPMTVAGRAESKGPVDAIRVEEAPKAPADQRADETLDRLTAAERESGRGAAGTRNRAAQPFAIAPVPSASPAGAAAAQAAKAPMIARVVSLRIVASDFDRVRPSVDKILADVGGFVGQLSASGARGTSRTLTGTVRVPAARLDDAVTALKALGQVIQESQSGEDVTEQSVDLDARLVNARNTEKRLTDVLQQRTGKVGDVLDVEREIARVREDIERMDAERTNLTRRVVYATITLEIVEERKAEMDLGPLSVPAQFRNAIVDGFRGAFESALNAMLLAARVGPSLMLWGVVLVWPAWFVRRPLRRPVVSEP